MSGFRVRRVYDEPEPDGGRRVLVDRVWPRGVSRERADIDEWAKDVTPSTSLRKWYHDGGPDRYRDFRERYHAELDAPEAADAVARLRDEGRDGTVTLLTSVKDVEHSHVPVLVERLEE